MGNITRADLQEENYQKEQAGLKAIARYCLTNHLKYEKVQGTRIDYSEGVDFYMNDIPYDLKVCKKRIWVDINRYDTIYRVWTSPIHNHPEVMLAYLYENNIYIVSKRMILDVLGTKLKNRKEGDIHCSTKDGNYHVLVDYTDFVLFKATLGEVEKIPLTPQDERNQESE